MKRSFLRHASAAAAVAALAACAGSNPPAPQPFPVAQAGDVAPHVDARSHLRGGLMDAGEATSGLKVVAKAVSPPGFLGITNSDLSFTGKYAIQGNYNGPVIWDMTNPANRSEER